MNADIQRLEELLQGETVLNAALFESCELYEALDARDTAEFEEAWLRVDAALRETDGAPAEDPEVTQVRKTAYLRTYLLTQEPDVCAAVSDDMGLVALALLRGYDDRWLSGLWTDYRAGRFPRPPINPVPVALSELLE